MAGVIRFAADAMLVRLSRYLRVVGCDASCETDVSLPTRIERADAEGRVFLTRSGHIGYQLPEPVRMLRIASEDPVVQLREVLEAFSIDPLARIFTRCIRCNVGLEPVPKEDLEGVVPERVFARYRGFFTCPACKTVFWRGSHVSNTCRKLGLPDAAERTLD